LVFDHLRFITTASAATDTSFLVNCFETSNFPGVGGSKLLILANNWKPMTVTAQKETSYGDVISSFENNFNRMGGLTGYALFGI